jgi:competence protein ComEA
MLKGMTTFKIRALAVGLFAALALTAALAAPAAAQTAKVDLNTADLKTIAALPGIGETLAQKIIDARPFKKLDDLSAVKGIGQAKLDGLKGLVKFSKVEEVKEKAVTEKVKATTKETTVEKAKTTETPAEKEEKVLINVNKADLKTLTTLPGIGEATAQKIIDGRPYKTLDDLGKVKGLGEAKLKDLKGLVAFEDKVKEKTAKTVAAKETTAADRSKTTPCSESARSNPRPSSITATPTASSRRPKTT